MVSIKTKLPISKVKFQKTFFFIQNPAFVQKFDILESNFADLNLYLDYYAQIFGVL